MKKLLKKQAKAFTLVEMLIVLGVISVLLLLFVPNLSRQKEAVKQSGGVAIVKVVASQKELYELKFKTSPSTADLVREGYITAEQEKAYNEHQANAVEE